MSELNNGGGECPQPEREVTLEKLDPDVRDAIDQVDLIDLGGGHDPDRERKRSFRENFLLGAFFLALSIGIGVWLDSGTNVSADPLTHPEVNIGVDPN